MRKVAKTSPTVDEIAEMATRGEDVSRFFTNQFTVVRPVRMLRDLDGKENTEGQSQGLTSGTPASSKCLRSRETTVKP